MLIGKEKIREIVERTDIVQLIGRHVQLKQAGRSFRGLCPFHGERTPSFFVTPERRSYKCFGCQKGGDAISFLMEYEGKDFLTAVRELAAEAGVTIVHDPEEDRRLVERRELLWACQVAAQWFEEQLWGPQGEAGRRHLQSRGVSEAVAKQVGLGYAPLGWHGLRERLQRERVPVERAITAGLLATKNQRTYDVFRGRLMIPIRDPDRRVIAFGGRVVEGDDHAKYINSKETPLYVKSRVLYGLDLTRDAIRRSGEAVLVEGYFDAIALWEAGIDNAVALCSTVLTTDHLAHLRRLDVSTLWLLLDGDDAGRRAAARLAGPILADGLSARVLELPDGQDPDTFIASHGVDGYGSLQAAAKPLSSYVIDGALSGGRSTYEEKLAALGELRPVLQALPEGASRALFIDELAKHLGIAGADVARFYGGARPQLSSQPPPLQDAMPPTDRRGPAMRRQPPGNRREIELVACLLAEPSLVVDYGRAIAAGVADDGLREVANLLLAGELTIDELLARVDRPLAESLSARIRERLRSPDRDWRQEMEDGLVQLELERLQKERRGLIQERDALAEDPAEREECARRLALVLGRMEQLRDQLRGAG